MSAPWHALFLMLAGAVLCAKDLKKHDSQGNITCSQGLKECTVVNKNCVLPQCEGALPPSTLVEVFNLNVEPALCGKTTMKHKACLLIRIQLRVLADDDVSGETPDDSENEDSATLTMCYMSAPNLMSCKEINFIVKSNTRKNQNETVTVEVQDGVFLGSTVTVMLNNMSEKVHVPPLNSVPKISANIDEFRGVMELKAEPEEPEVTLQLCVKRKGMTRCQPSEWILPLHAVTHCMCFQAWKQNKDDEISYRSEICPFEKHEGFRRNTMKNVSLSVRHGESNEGRPALNWNLSAPCRLEGEVWPCQMAVHVGGGCREVPRFRRNISMGWEENISTVWKSDSFLDVRTTNNLPACVMFKVDGQTFGPFCEDYTPRVRWICLVIVALLLVVLLTVAVFVLRIRHREWLSNSIPTHQSQGLRGEVLLVHSSGSDPSFSDIVCWFATWLSDLGFSVSLDLWNQAEVNKLGPTPWLHSRLQHVQTRGGKILLLLSHDAVLRAKTYSEHWSCVSNEDDDKTSRPSWLWNTDVFSSALSSLFSACLHGGTTEHFALVQLEAEALQLPELFQGLKLYQLPSESQCLLSDLQTRHLRSFGAQLKMFLWTWRASVRLEKRLRNCEEEQRSRTESTVTHVESLNMEKDTEEETLPLNSTSQSRAEFTIPGGMLMLCVVLFLLLAAPSLGNNCSEHCKACGGPERDQCLQCLPGFMLHDNVCVDFDECGTDLAKCPANTYCINTHSSYVCRSCDRACVGCMGSGPTRCKKCAPGYRSADLKCLDIDECSEEVLACSDLNALCVNTEGSFQCDCAPGFTRRDSMCVRNQTPEGQKPGLFDDLQDDEVEVLKQMFFGVILCALATLAAKGDMMFTSVFIGAVAAMVGYWLSDKSDRLLGGFLKGR
ncbi:hypothetical protein QTP86_025096 [Hemibagrus guttatus]|nr:hypothetical protein QTP86_025096 [Hemibagrus guttatus]